MPLAMRVNGVSQASLGGSAGRAPGDVRTKQVGLSTVLRDYSKIMRDPGDFILKICKAL